MNSDIDIWQLLAGLGLFLFGMHQLENALTRLAGRSFKRFLRRHTTPPIRGVLAGALSTAALQSSSVVSLIVLAFVATGIVSLAGALSIVFGANLGTTATGWIVATVGFKLDIESIALPLIAAGGAGVALARSHWRVGSLSRLVLGFGLMLLALAFMKDGVASVSGQFDPAALAGQPLIIFLLVGMLISAVVQSSSATIMLTLSALNAEILTLPAAVAVAIGGDLGTTSTSLLGAIAGSAAKKRVA
ncbi:MAG: Na/Pi cotransporter family protein, partial [Woeseia sp.]|nr:Na/Pi cotransporter family protein [Woeseia sp.]